MHLPKGRAVPKPGQRRAPPKHQLADLALDLGVTVQRLGKALQADQRDGKPTPNRTVLGTTQGMRHYYEPDEFKRWWAGREA